MCACVRECVCVCIVLCCAYFMLCVLCVVRDVLRLLSV